MSKSYVVTAVGVQCNVIGGLSTMLPRGSGIPENVDPAWLDHNLRLGLVEEGDPISGVQLFGGDGKPLTMVAGDVVDDYKSWTVNKLKAEIDDRNEGRDADALIAPDSDKKADLVAALELDDEVHG